MPSFASGVRIGAAVAPIGAVVGEWVGSSGGLGYLMLHANAKMQIEKQIYNGNEIVKKILRLYENTRNQI